jgi:hypothetical protein
MRTVQTLTVTSALAMLCLLCACSPKQAAEPAASTTPPAQAPATVEQATPALERTPSPEGAKVFFITPKDGATVTSPVHIEFGIEGMTVVPAGDQTPNSGHHHLLVDTPLPDLSMPIPKDAQHIHFGDGSTSTDLELSPGKHTLQLLLGDYRHVPHDPPVYSKPITITVE